MKKLTLGVAIAALLQGVAASKADELAAGDLYDFCRSDSPVDGMACKFYIVGAVQGLKLAAAKLNDTTEFCIPDDLGDAQLTAIYVKTAQSDFLLYPDDRQAPAISIVAAIMKHAFKCNKVN